MLTEDNEVIKVNEKGKLGMQILILGFGKRG